MPVNAGEILPATFFARDAVTVARDLLGRVLVHETSDGTACGRLVEVEAYRGPADRAAHSYGGRRTARNEAMYGPPGHAYVYLIYGRNYCFNIVTADPGEPEAVLVRALEPLAGTELMAVRRDVSLRRPADLRLLTAGPGRLAQALGLTSAQNGLPLLGPPLYLLAGEGADPENIVAAPRINVDYAGEWRDLPWRFLLRDSPFVSVPPPGQRRARMR